MNPERRQFEPKAWAQLPALLANLPRPVALHLWADEAGSAAEREAIRLARTLAAEFGSVRWQQLPHRANYHYYPVLGVMGLDGDAAVDFGVRLIGLPAGHQFNSLIAAVQAVAFRGQTSEALTRIQLHRLAADVTLEILTTTEDEAGTYVAHSAFNMAVSSPRVRTYLVMADQFPEAFVRHNPGQLPHVIINGRIHLEGVVSEEVLLQHIGRAIRTTDVTPVSREGAFR
jgi:alkyl hydroperoxide reductase subunit AhpF